MPLHLRLGSREFRASWLMILLTLAGVVIFVLLGRWQWQRAAEKRAALTAFAAGSAQIEIPGNPAVGSLARYSRIEVSGHYQGQRQFLLDNISRDGRAGFEVLTPMRLDDGRTLLVNRGWVPLRDGERKQLPDVLLDSAVPAESRISGRIDELPSAGLALGRAPPAAGSSWPKVTSFPTSAELAQALGLSVEPRQLLLDADQPGGYRRDWRPANAAFGPERHMSYAVQWWSLAALAATLLLVLNLRRV